MFLTTINVIKQLFCHSRSSVCMFRVRRPTFPDAPALALAPRRPSYDINHQLVSEWRRQTSQNRSPWTICCVNCFLHLLCVSFPPDFCCGIYFALDQLNFPGLCMSPLLISFSPPFHAQWSKLFSCKLVPSYVCTPPLPVPTCVWIVCFVFWFLYWGCYGCIYINIIYLLPALLIKLYFDPFPCFSAQSSEEQDRMGTEETVHIRISRRRRSQIWHQWYDGCGLYIWNLHKIRL